MRTVRILVVGCTGRMGARILALAADDPAFELVGAVTEPGHAAIGHDAGTLHGGRALGLTVADAFDGDCDVVIEFSTPAGCAEWVRWSAKRGHAIVSGTTGLDRDQRACLEAAAEYAPVFWAPNMSIGASLLIQLASQAAEALGNDVEIEITETHHSAKIDAPSGTAAALLSAVCRRLGRDPDRDAVYGRKGECGPRKPGEIGVHSLRIGDVVGEHEIRFDAGRESLSLRHEAHSRDAFAAGALRAAGWLVDQPNGRYGMRDLLPGRSWGFSAD